jgi:hypothetical protein
MVCGKGGGLGNGMMLFLVLIKEGVLSSMSGTRNIAVCSNVQRREVPRPVPHAFYIVRLV